MKILAISDLHGSLPDIPKCDILIIGGDICPMLSHKTNFQYRWLDTEFRKWLKEVPAQHIVGIAGNHDFVFEENFPELPWNYLIDEEITIGGIRMYGTPWVPNLKKWAFYGNDNLLDQKTKEIPDNLDILISHGPPRGYGDKLAGFFGERVGCTQLTHALARAKPKVTVCGHIHEGRGLYLINDLTTLYNVSYMNELYEPTGSTVELVEFLYPE